MAAMWRQEQALHPTFLKLNNCLQTDWFLLPFELRLQKAHAAALEAGGLLAPRERAALEDALAAIEKEFGNAACPASDAEDLHTWMENELTRRAGDAGRKIHTARSRNDQVATLLKLYVIAVTERMADDLSHLAAICCRRAGDWAEVPLVLHTHQQFAAPGNAGFWILRFAVSFARILDHVRHYLAEWRQTCPLGSGAVAGSSLAVDRAVQARLLGFSAPSINALHSTSCRDECLEWLHLASLTALHLQGFAADILLFAQTPLAWVQYPGDFATGSSMMPNKVNPDAMELLRGEANAVHAAQHHALLLLKGLPSGYNRDLQGIKPLVRDAAEKLHELCRMAAAFVDRLQFDTERTSAAMQQGAIQATLAMEALVAQGTPLREAHHRVAAAVRDGAGFDAKSPVEMISAYCTPGSAGPDETRRAANSLRDRIRRSEP